MRDRIERGSARLAAAVVARVAALHPTVRIEVVDERPEQHFTIASFIPANQHGAPVTLYANFDWSFSLESGRFRFFDDEPMHDDNEGGRLELIVGEIEAIAKSGLPRSRVDRLLGFGADRVLPWSD